MHAKTSLQYWLAAVALTTTITSAQAAVFLAAVGGGGTGENLIFNGCAAPVTSGTTLSGCISSNHALLVDAIGNESLVVAGGGQATIKGADGSLTQLTIDPTNFAATKIILNIDASANGFVTFNDALGLSPITLAVNGNGSNFFTLTGGDLNFITLASSAGINFSEVQQVRFESAVIAAVPEPQEWAMLVAGLAIVSAIAKRRKTD
jgi:hypothetical protein